MRTFDQYLNEAKWAVVIKASGDFDDPDRLTKGKIDHMLNVITGEVMPVDPKNYFPGNSHSLSDSKKVIKNFIADGDVVFGSKEEIMAIAKTNKSLANTLKQSGTKIKKI